MAIVSKAPLVLDPSCMRLQGNGNLADTLALDIVGFEPRAVCVYRAMAVLHSSCMISVVWRNVERQLTNKACRMPVVSHTFCPFLFFLSSLPLPTPDLPCTYLAHHEPGSVIIIIIVSIALPRDQWLLVERLNVFLIG